MFSERGADITPASISGVSIDYGAPPRGGAPKQYKTINATAPLSKAGGENGEPRMAGRGLGRGHKSGQSHQKAAEQQPDLAQKAAISTAQGDSLASPHTDTHPGHTLTTFTLNKISRTEPGKVRDFWTPPNL